MSAWMASSVPPRQELRHAPGTNPIMVEEIPSEDVDGLGSVMGFEDRSQLRRDSLHPGQGFREGQWP